MWLLAALALIGPVWSGLKDECRLFGFSCELGICRALQVPCVSPVPCLELHVGNKLGDLAPGSFDLPVAENQKLTLDTQQEASERSRE